MTRTHPIAADWLARAERLAADLPPGVRAELMSDLREHVAAATAADDDDQRVIAALDRLGDPVDVVASALEDADAAGAGADLDAVGTSDGLRPVEAVVLLLLVIAGPGLLIFWPLALVAWVVAVALAATRGRWRGGELIGVGLLPATWAATALSVLTPVGVSTTSCVADSTGVEQCVTEGGGASPVLLVIALALLVASVLVTRRMAAAPDGRPLRR